MNETLQVIARRRSTRGFSKEQVPEAQLQAVLEAGLCAPNAGDQAWHFSVVQSAQMLSRMNLLAKTYAATCGLPWLEQLGKDPDFDCLYGAPTLILISCDGSSPVGVYDASAATQNLLIAAESLGLGACWAYFVTQALMGPDGPSLRKALEIPEGYQVYTSVMLGHRAGEPSPPPERKPNLVSYCR